MSGGAEPDHSGRIETFRPPCHLDLQQHWRCRRPDGGESAAAALPWAERHRPDWVERGMLAWPRGGLPWQLRQRLRCPEGWRGLGAGRARARLVLRWWAERAELRVDGRLVEQGDLFETSCRWPLPSGWWDGEVLDLELRLRSPRHDDGALVHSRVELEPLGPGDPHGLLADAVAELHELRRLHGRPAEPGPGEVRLLGHAHLDLAWLWPVADTWDAAERTFASVLALMGRHPALHFGHSTPALYAWLERMRPALYGRIRRAMREGRWEPLNGPWVETDCVLVSTASLLRQFREGQLHSLAAFPEWDHPLAWLPDSFGFSAGLPPVAAATGVRWFCTHKLAWNADHPFPHRLFRWRGRCGGEVLALMTAPIGSDGDPLAIERQRIAWQDCCGQATELLWLPGVGDHGGGPTGAMLEQLAAWNGHPAAAPQRHGTLRQHLRRLEPLAGGLPVWRDELYLELHRGCATSRPDQKRHNRSLERLLREAELARALARTDGEERDGTERDGIDWRPLLFHQFHDILPGTAIPEVFAQAGPLWRRARRRARRQRDRALGAVAGSPLSHAWTVFQLLPLPAVPRTVRLPAGRWSVPGEGPGCGPLATQPASAGGCWVQLPPIAGAAPLELERQEGGAPATPWQPVRLAPAPELGPDHWCLENGLVAAVIGPRGVEQLLDRDGRRLLAAPLAWCRFRDRGAYWDAWDIAADHRAHPLPWDWSAPPTWEERGPLCARFLWRGRCGASRVRLDGRLLAGSPWLELVLRIDWRQRHELLRLELPLAGTARRWAADTPGGVIERPATARTPREQARWEVPVVSWMASVGDDDGLALLLDGPQGVSAAADRLGVSLLRGPTWPDPGADNGQQRLRLALMPCSGGWRREGVTLAAQRLREPLWWHPRQRPGPAGWRPLPPLPPDLRLLGLRPAGDGSGEVILSLQNEGPCRRRLALPAGWRMVARLDGLDRPEASGGDPYPDPLALGPWQLGFWRLHPGGGAAGAGAAQSS